MVRLMTAVEHLAQNLHRYGLRISAPDLPVLRLPVPENPHPEKFTYTDSRAMLQQFIDDLEAAADILAEVHDPQVKLLVPVGLIRLDLDGDGTAAESESFWTILQKINPRVGSLDAENQRSDIGFDAGDVPWMIGYTHVLRAMMEAWLAQDYEHFHNLLAPHLFAGAPGSELELKSQDRADFFDADSVADAIAAIHLTSFELAEPERMPRVRQHLIKMVACSRRSWELILEETDDEREWIPNSKQSSVLGLSVSEAQIETWQQVLNQIDAALDGKLLIPHWRLPVGTGINLKRVFEEPRGFDLVMWVHGAAAIPYAEQGEVATQRTAQTLTAAFGGQFFLFAVWFN
jgi:hypothetical protein